MKSADERMESLERAVKFYRIIALLLVLLLFVAERYAIVRWVDSVETWFSGLG